MSKVSIPAVSKAFLPDASMRLPALSLVVPLYNEEHRFEETAPQLVDFIAGFPLGSELIFVDDGSIDRTASVVSRFIDGHSHVPARLLRLPHMGKGSAVRAGLEAAKAAYAGFCDVDLSTPLTELGRMVRSASTAPVLVIASRGMAESRVVVPESSGRQFLGRCYNRVVRLVLTPGISDTQCGAKVAATAVWRAILSHCSEVGFAWDVEAVAVSRRLGIPVWEVAIEWHHDNRSRVRPGTDGAAMVLALPRIWSGVRAIQPARTPVRAGARRVQYRWRVAGPTLRSVATVAVAGSKRAPS